MVMLVSNKELAINKSAVCIPKLLQKWSRLSREGSVLLLGDIQVDNVLCGILRNWQMDLCVIYPFIRIILFILSLIIGILLLIISKHSFCKLTIIVRMHNYWITSTLGLFELLFP